MKFEFRKGIDAKKLPSFLDKIYEEELRDNKDINKTGMVHHYNKGTFFGKRTNNSNPHSKRKHNQSTEKFIYFKKEGKMYKTNYN